MANGRNFEVLLLDYSVSVDEWMQAQAASRTKLPPLSKQQREVARKMGIPVEEYQRNVLAGQLGEMRLQSKGEALGLVVQELLRGLGPGYRLESIKGDPGNERWICTVGTPDIVANVAIPRELADDALDSGAKDEVQRLARHLAAELRGSGLIGKH
jgi:hypothetical protein